MTGQSLPTVTALVAAYNYEQYVGAAVLSALAQEYPTELLDVVVVDDGSQDGSASVVREIAVEHPGRVTLIQQPNAGATAALNRARREARGELLALLDADDMWLPSKTLRQVERFLARPELSGVFCDMNVIDGQDRVTLARKYKTENPQLAANLAAAVPGQYALLLQGNVATHSSIMVRAETFEEIPAEVPYADWWLNLCATRRSCVELVDEPLALYRIHGANLTGGVDGNQLVREKLKSVRERFLAIRELGSQSLTAAEIAFVWQQGAERAAAEVHQAAGSRFVRLMTVNEDERQTADRLAEEARTARAVGDFRREAAALLASLAWNPTEPARKLLLQEALADREAAEARPHPLRGARGYVVLAEARDLVASPQLLTAFAQALSGQTDVTLAIDAGGLAHETIVPQIQTLLEQAGLGESEELHMLLFCGDDDGAQRLRVQACADAVYSSCAELRDSAVAELLDSATVPAFTLGTLAELRERAVEHCGEGLARA